MQFNYHNPYLATRIPVFARNVVSTSHPLAAQAGLRILQQGGNDFAKIVGKTLSSEDYGIAVAKSNTALDKDVDKALDTLKQNGEYDKLYKKWFGEMPKK